MHRSLSRSSQTLIMIAVTATGLCLGYTMASHIGWLTWQQIPFQLLAHDLFMGPSTTSHPGAPELYVITSSADVERIAADVLNIPPGLDEQRPGFVAALRTADFNRYLGVLALSHQRSGCAQFTVRRVSQIQHQLVLHADIHAPSWGRACPAIQTDPGLVIIVPKEALQSPLTTVILRNGWVDVAHATVAP